MDLLLRLVTQNFLLNYFLFKITVNLSKKVEFSSEKQKDTSDDGTLHVFKLPRHDIFSMMF